MKMPNSDAKLSTDYLTKEMMHAALLALPAVLRSLVGEHKLIAMYGWGANIHGDLMWKPMGEDTRWVEYLIEDSIKQRIVVPGELDFLLEVPQRRLEIMFCHECDIHLDGLDDELLSGFIGSSPYSQFHWHTREEVEKMMP